MPDLSDEVHDLPEPPNLRFLRRMVTVLTMVMIAGVVLIIALLVIRLNARPDLMPETLDLPKGAKAQAVTRSRDWIAVVTDQNEILIFDPLSGDLRQTVTLKTAD